MIMGILKMFKRNSRRDNKLNNQEEKINNKKIAEELRLEIEDYNLEKINTSLNNSFLINDCIFFLSTK